MEASQMESTLVRASTFICSAIVSSSLFAARLSLSSASDYVYTSPAVRSSIIGLGMGKNGDYRILRSEDVAFLYESWIERDGGKDRSQYPYDSRYVDAFDISAALYYEWEAISLNRSVSYDRYQTFIQNMKKCSKNRTTRGDLNEEAYSVTNSWYGFIPYDWWNIDEGPRRYIAQTNIQYLGYWNLDKAKCTTKDIDTDVRQLSSIDRSHYIDDEWYYNASAESWTNRITEYEYASTNQYSYNSGYISAYWVKRTYVGFDSERHYIGFQNGHYESDGSRILDGLCFFDFPITNGQSVVSVKPAFVIKWTHNRIIRDFGQSSTNIDLGSGYFLYPGPATRVSGNRFSVNFNGSTCQQKVREITGETIPDPDRLKSFISNPPPDTTYPGQLRTSTAEEYIFYEIVSFVVAAEIEWNARVLDQ